MAQADRLALGLDFGTESIRALLVDLTGTERGSAVVKYRHGQITETLPTSGERLPHDYALQHPGDWIDSSAKAVRKAMQQARAKGDSVVGIGVDFTSCTMLPALRDGTPLCLVKELAEQPLAWPKLWKHHGAKSQTDRINQLARSRTEDFLKRYGGIIGLEWFFPKIFETLEVAPKVFDAAEVWLEAGDWFVWQLVGGDVDSLPRSTCQAGYKAMWSKADGYPSEAFLGALHPKMARVAKDRMPGRLLAPGEAAGELHAGMARLFGLPPGIPVSAAIIDAHAGVPGAGAAEAGTLVMVMGTSSCHMLNSHEDRYVPGVAGVVQDGILPGFFGYETGQAAVGDSFDWLRRTLGHRDFDQLTKLAAGLPAGAEGVLAIDWLNGCRTPLMNGALTGAFLGITLNHGAGHLYRALLEASAFGVRWIVELLREHGVPVKKLLATGGLPHANPLLVQIYADVLGQPVVVHPSKQGPALGAAILGVLAAGRKASGFASPTAAIRAMAAPRTDLPGREARTIKPQRSHVKAYDAAYQRYRDWAATIAEK